MFCVFLSLSGTFPSLPVVYFVNDFLFLSRLLLPLLWNHPIATKKKKKRKGLTKKKKFWTAPLNTDVDVPIVASNKSWQQWHLQQWSLSTLWRVVQRFQSREQWMFFFFPFKYELWAAIQLHITAADAALANHSTLATRIQGVKGCQGLLRSFKVRFFILKKIFFTEKKSGHVTGGMPGTLFGLAEFDPTNFLKAIVVKNV